MPANTSQPTVSGDAVEGETLTGTDGTWDDPAATFSRQWQRSDGLGGYDDIDGETGTGYVLTADDVDHTIRLRVIATNGDGDSDPAFSAPTVTVTAAPEAPDNTSPPTISGSTVEGATLTGDDGTWTGVPPPSFSRQWQRSDGLGGFDDIPGETGTTYTLTADDVGHTIRLAVTGSNTEGSETAFSAPTSTVTAAPEAPDNTSPPTISGSAVEGATLTGDDGTWTGVPPPSLSRQWQRSDGVGGFDAIPGETGTTYVLMADDVGHTIRLAVTGSNTEGSETAFSAPTGTVTALPEPPERSLELFVTRRLNAFKRATIRASGVAAPPLRLWVLENRRGKTCPTTPAERTRRIRTVIDGVTVGGDFSEERRPRMKRPGRHAFCAYLGPDEDSAHMTSFATRKVRAPFLSASRARETVEDALRRHDFASRVVNHLRQSCARRSRSEFECGFSSRFPGFSLSGQGSVERKRRLNYRFVVSSQGRSFTLTDENEGRLRG